MGSTDLTVKNSVEFCEQMKHVKLEEGDKLLSFDVVSLFTSIPVELAIQVATNVLSYDATLQDRSTIPVDDVVDLLDFCLPTTNFKYNNTFLPADLWNSYGFSCLSGNGKPWNGRP